MLRGAAVVALLLALVPAHLVLASGYHPFFDEAFEKAELVVSGKVTAFREMEGRNPYPQVNPARLPWGTCYMDVEKVYKGALRPGTRVVVWDPYELTTASYFLRHGVLNLTFLVRVDLARHANERVLAGEVEQMRVRDTDLGKFTDTVYMPISNQGREDWGVDEYDGWTQLLELRLHPPKDLLAEYRHLVRKSSNRYVLEYILSHWPKPLPPQDVSLLREVVKRHANDPYITSPAVEALNAQGEGPDPADVVDILERTPWYGRDTAIALVNGGNIDRCRDILFKWMRGGGGRPEWLGGKPDPGASVDQQDATEALARLAPEFLEAKLAEVNLPFWQLAPALQALGLNGSDVGKPDYPKEILKLNPYTLRNLGAVCQGDGFQAICLMGGLGEADATYVEEREEWRTGLPLLLPALRSGDRTTRRLIRALIGSLGFDPRISPTDEGGRALTPLDPPVRLTLELVTPQPTTSGPVVVRLWEEAAARDTVLCFTGEAEWTISGADGSCKWGAASGAFEDPDPPEDQFVTLKPGETRTEEEDLADSILNGGTYRVWVVKVYAHDGTDHGLKAWTGAVVSNTLEFTVTEGEARTGRGGAGALLARTTERRLLAQWPVALASGALLTLLAPIVLLSLRRRPTLHAR